MGHDSLIEAARRVIKSECRIYALRSVDPTMVSIEDSVRQTRWVEWWAELKKFPVHREWLRSALLDVKIDAMQEVSATVGGFDFTLFDQDFSVDRLLPLN